MPPFPARHLLTRPFTSLQPRQFHTTPSPSFPLQPAKSRKTTPFTRPRRPKLCDPLLSDPFATQLEVQGSGGAVLVVREPKSLKSPRDDVGSVGGEKSELSRLLGGIMPPSVPTSAGDYLPPPVRPQHHLSPESLTAATNLTPEVLAKIRKMRPTSTVSALSKKFGVPKPLVMMFGCEGKEERNAVRRRVVMREIKREEKMSVERKLGRVERRMRRELW